MPLGEAALRSHGRGACRLVPGRSRWKPRTHGRPLRCFGCGNRPSRGRRGRPNDDSHWRQDFECLRGAQARRHAQPLGDNDVLAHRRRHRCAISRTVTRSHLRSVLEHRSHRVSCHRVTPGRRTSYQGCCCAVHTGPTDPWNRPDARTRPPPRAMTQNARAARAAVPWADAKPETRRKHHHHP